MVVMWSGRYDLTERRRALCGEKFPKILDVFKNTIFRVTHTTIYVKNTPNSKYPSHTQLMVGDKWRALKRPSPTLGLNSKVSAISPILKTLLISR